MNRPLSLCCIGILSSFSFAQVGASHEPSEAQIAALTAEVQSMPASKLDRKLPPIRFEDWLRAQAGPEAMIGWPFRYEPANDKSADQRLPDFVEADVTLKDGRTFFVMIDVSAEVNRPRLHDAAVIVNKKDIVEVRRLSALPRVLRETSRNLNASEANHD